MSQESKSSLQLEYAFEYHYRAGSMPPPAHYEYTIRVAPNGESEIVFYPDYLQHNPPVWSERFSVPHSALSRVNAKITEKRTLTRQWRAPAHSSTGGSLESLTIETPDKTIAVPSHLNARDAADSRELYDAVRALVPQPIWDSLWARRQAFEEEYFAHRPQGHELP